MSSVEAHNVVSRAEWLAARKELLRKEKALTRVRDQVSAERRALPWVKIEKNYLFEGPRGTESLADLFGSDSQLIIQHFMFGPGWGEGCVGCSFGSDHVDAAWVHLQHHDLAFAAVSRAPWTELEAFQRRMGWKFKWVSSFGSDFNYDFHVSFTPEEVAKGKSTYNYDQREVGEELPGLSVFYKNAANDIFHTYSAYARGAEETIGAYMFLDLSPKGRNEEGDMTGWVRHRDRYGDPTVVVAPDGRAKRIVPPPAEPLVAESRS
jgi:predicted dithiol-disulfide oxidoreductase (DUF899 family)